MSNAKLIVDIHHESTLMPQSEEEMRKLLKPNLTHEQVLCILTSSYCHSEHDTFQVVRQLDSYDDNNFLVSICKTKYLLKISNGVESRNYIENKNDSIIHLQNLIFHHLDKCDINSSLPIPATLAEVGTESSLISLHSLPVISSSHSPQTLVVRLLRWVEGSPISSIPTLSIETLAEAGYFLGKTCLALDILASEPNTPEGIGNWYHAWDGKQTSDLRKYLYCITNEKRRKMVENVITRFEEEILPDSSMLRTGILQADYNDANIILNNGKISGVIDFGDTVESWRVLDVTVAMAYAMLSTYGKSGHYMAAAAAILRGFHSCYPLTQIERKHLLLLMTCRLACSVTLGAYSIQQNPGNKYLLLHAEPGWKALEFLTQGDMNVVNSIESTFRLACDSENYSMEEGVIDCLDLSYTDSEILDMIEQGTSLHTRKRKRNNPTITFVTGNKKKLEEVKRILSPDGDNIPFTITNHKVDLPELQGEPMDIAREKCAHATREIDGPVITEDTSLCYNALNGLPGPYIKWFLEKCGHKGLNQIVEGFGDKSAYAQTIVGFCNGPNDEVHLFDGRTQGKIVSARGKLDFGWDPVFEPFEGDGKTYAEMTSEEKDAISHRSRAFQRLREFLSSYDSNQKQKL